MSMRAGLIAALFLIASQRLERVQASVDVDPRWPQAAQLQAQGRHVAAAHLYAALLADYPDSQKAAVLAGANSYLGGNVAGAVDALESAFELDSFGKHWADVGLFYQARACTEFGCVPTAREAISLLKRRFPESVWTARAAVLEAELDGRDASPLEAALALDLAAANAYEQAQQLVDAQDNQVAVAALDDVIADYPDSRTAWRAMETRAYVLCRLGEFEEARTAFAELVDESGDALFESRIAQEAATRLAAFEHKAMHKEAALERYSDLAVHATNPKVRSNATLQAAGLYFELRQAECWQGVTVAADQWAEARRRSEQVRALPSANTAELATAELMILETYLWEGQPAECLRRAEEFIAAHEYPTYRRELSTARLFAGESLLQLGRSGEALVLFQWLTAEYEANGTIWPWDYLHARAYYRVFDALVRSGAPPQDADAAAAEVLERFAASRSADLIRTALAQRAPAD